MDASTKSEHHVYQVRSRKDKRGVDLISDALPFGRLWYEDASAAVGYAKHSSRSHDAVIRVYDDAGNVIETHEHAGDFQRVALGASLPQLEIRENFVLLFPYNKLGRMCFLRARRFLLGAWSRGRKHESPNPTGGSGE